MSAALDLRSKEEKDAELDRRIAALRRKNEAIIRRYQEIEEDRKKAEQEGVAVTALRRARDPSGPPQEQRPGKEKAAPGGSRLGRGSGPRPSGRSPRGDPSGDPALEGAGDRKQRGRGLGKAVARGNSAPCQASKWELRRRQNIERMNEEMEKIAEYERSQRDGLPEKNPVRNFLDDPRRSGPSQDSDRRDGSRRHGRNWGGPDFDKVKTGMERDRTWPSPGRAAGAGDMTLSMTGRERAEYLRWKQERERIDRERLARHRKPGGQWRREWDAEKSDSMFLEGSAAAPSWDSASRDELRRPAPKPPTLAEFLPQQKPRGRGLGAKSYSMHDNRWEEKEPAEAPASESWETEEAPTGEPPHSLTPEEEEEEQWEDVSEEDEEEDEDEDEDEDGSEEEEEEDGGSAEAPSKEEAPPRLSPLEPPQRDEARSDAEQEAEDGMRGSLDPAPGTVEIADFHRDHQPLRRPRAVAPAPASLPP